LPNKPKPSRRNAPPRKSHRRFALPPRSRVGWRAKLALAAASVVLALLAWGVIARQLAPGGNTILTRFDAIIVLGTPADRDGNPTPELLQRVTEGVREYERGVAPRLILSGGASPNGFVQARVMAQTAHAQGIPETAIIVEPDAKDTIQNACFSARIMRAHGWRSAEVVSSASHLPRTGLIFSRLPVEWRTHAAPALSPSLPADSRTVTLIETLKTVRYLVWSRQFERCEP